MVTFVLSRVHHLRRPRRARGDGGQLRDQRQAHADLGRGGRRDLLQGVPRHQPERAVPSAGQRDDHHLCQHGRQGWRDLLLHGDCCQRQRRERVQQHRQRAEQGRNVQAVRAGGEDRQLRHQRKAHADVERRQRRDLLQGVPRHQSERDVQPAGQRDGDELHQHGRQGWRDLLLQGDCCQRQRRERLQQHRQRAEQGRNAQARRTGGEDRPFRHQR